MTDDLIQFKPDDNELHVIEPKKPWKVLIADDDDEVHVITKLALSDYEYLGRPIKFFDSHCYQSSIDILSVEPDIALILLDVVMDEPDTGLKIVNFVRNVIHDKKTRIILRTGEPGSAPERSVITQYDINDYKEKTELTSTKLYTSVHTSIKNYNDIRTIHSSRDCLNHIISNSASLHRVSSLKKFIQSTISQFANLLQTNPDVVLLKEAQHMDAAAFAITGEGTLKEPVVGTGKYKDLGHKNINELLQVETLHAVDTAFKLNRVVTMDGVIACPFASPDIGRFVLLLEGYGILDGFDYSLLNVFLSHICSAMENNHLHREIFETQAEIINVLGEVVETRSAETSAHVRRVSKISILIAVQMDYAKNKLEQFGLAAVLHDLGKIGIPDSILTKPGKLSLSEFEEVKKHTTIGADILKSSQREIFKLAKDIAIDHHEKWDGSGYPNGKRGSEICFEARIVALADVYDALRSDRSYKQAWDRLDTLDYIKSQSGKQFDPIVVEHFLMVESKVSALYD